MNIKQKLVAHVLSIAGLIVAFQLLVGFQMSWSSIIFFAVLLLFDLVGDFWTLLSIRRDVQRAMESMRAISRGDLSVPIQVTGQGELAEMQAVMKAMTGSLDGIILQIRQAALSVATESEHITQSANQLASSMDGQASATEETSGAISQIAVSIQQVASSISNVNDATLGAVQAAHNGHRAVEQTISGMGSISLALGDVMAIIENLGKSSSQIGVIVELIDDIAKQTNLLALNATIEAARALTSSRQGEDAVQGGSMLSQEAGGSLQAILASVERARSQMEEVAVVIKEQERASAQIVNASDSIKHSAQESSSSIATIAQSASGLQGQAKHLLKAIAFFDEDPSKRDLQEAAR